MKHKQTLRRGLGVLFGLVLCLTLLTVSALADEGDVNYRYYDETEKDWVTGTKDAAEYTAVTNSTVTWGEDDGEEHWYVVTDNVTIGTEDKPVYVDVHGDVHLILEDNCSLTIHGIILDTGSTLGNLTVYAQSDGDEQGSMSVYAPDYDNFHYYSRCAGICVWGDFTVHGGSVTARGAAKGNPYDSNYGISGKSFTVFGGTVTATGGQAGDSENSFGIFASDSVTISGSADVTATGGTVTNENSYGESYGICADTGDVTISGSANVTATGGAADYISFGIYADTGDVTISGGTVKATGGAADLSRGICAYEGDVTVSGGTVTATGGAEATYSYGILSRKSVTISGSANVTATGGAADYISYGIYVFKPVNSDTVGSISISGEAVVAATGGTVPREYGSGESYGIYAEKRAVTISDSAKVTATGGTVTCDGNSCGIYAVDSAVTISDSANVTAKGSTVTTVTGDGNSYGIYAANSAVTISDRANVTATGGAADYISYGIYAVDSAVTISGSTNVTATGDKVTGDGGNSRGIDTSGGDVIINGGTVNATGDAAAYSSYGILVESGRITISGGTTAVTAKSGKVTDNNRNSCGIYANGGIAVSGGEVDATGGETTGESSMSFGIYSCTDIAISGGSVTATGGAATGDYGTSCGIEAKGNIKVISGRVTAIGGTAARQSCGIYANSYSNVTISGSANVTATGGTALYSCGIHSDSSTKIAISGGTVTAIGGAATGESGGSYGIQAFWQMTISGQDTAVTARGGTAGQESYGICLYSGDVTIQGGTVTATGGAVTGEDAESCGIYTIYTGNGGVTIKGGTVTATGGEVTGEDAESFGILSNLYDDASDEYVDGTITISDGHVIARTLAGENGKALNVAPDLSGYTGCCWRTSTEDPFTANTSNPYTNDPAPTYVEFSDGSTYTVTFAPNDGEGYMSNVTGVSGIYTLPACDFTAPEGQRFKAWRMNGTEYAVGADITVSDNTTVTAVWEDIPVTTYTVTFDPNGGTLNEGSHSSIKTEANGTVDYLAAAAREGYTFDGWYTEKDGGEKVYTYVNTFTDNTVLYAHWTPVAQTKQITEAAFAMKGYTVGADAKNIVVTSHTEGLSLVGGYYEAQGKPFSYVLCEASGDNLNTVTEVTGKLEAGKNYVLLVKAGVDAGYETSGLTADAVILNGTITAAECDEDVIGEACASCVFMLPVLTESDTALTTNTVTVNDSYAATTGAGEYEEGDVVTLAAGSRSDYTFSGWTSDDITIPNAGSADTSFVMPAKAVTVTANWTETGSSGSSGGSGGSSGGSGFSTHTITVESAKNGAVTSSHKTASRGTTVTLTVTPDQGYELDTLTVTDGSGSKVSVTEKNGSYTFTMPASKVTVKAAFAETEEEKEQEKEKENPFVDVPKGAYYFDAVLWAAEKGVTGGTSATTFSPDSTCTRAQAVTFLWRAAGSPAPMSGANPFTDVAEGSYYYDAVLWAVQKGITGGTSATTFSPDATCTRAQIVTFLWRAQGSPAAGRANPFTDVAADAYYINAVLWAVENGITAGTGATTFSPNSDCTRAQIVTFLYRCLG